MQSGGIAPEWATIREMMHFWKIRVVARWSRQLCGRTRLEFGGGHLILRGADFESLGS